MRESAWISKLLARTSRLRRQLNAHTVWIGLNSLVIAAVVVHLLAGGS